MVPVCGGEGRAGYRVCGLHGQNDGGSGRDYDRMDPGAVPERGQSHEPGGDD